MKHWYEYTKLEQNRMDDATFADLCDEEFGTACSDDPDWGLINELVRRFKWYAHADHAEDLPDA